MSWRDNLLDASFKGVTFKVKSSDYTVGRRIQMHQYINREKPYMQDLGSEAEGFTIEGFIIQNINNSFDYFTERDALIKVLKRKGTGVLVHPFYGIKKVGLAEPASITETFDTGGMATFRMVFKEAGTRAISLGITNFIDSIDNYVNEKLDAVADFFANAYEVTGIFMDIPANAIQDSMRLTQTIINGCQAIPTKILNQAIGNINLMKNQISDILEAPFDIFNSMRDSCNTLMVLCGAGEKIDKEQKSKQGTPAEKDLVTKDRYTDIFITQINNASNVIGGTTGSYSGITRGEITKFDETEIAGKIGKSLIMQIEKSITEFNTDEYKVIPTEQQKNIILIFYTNRFMLLANLCRIAIRTVYDSQEEIEYYRERILQLFENYMFDLAAISADGSSAVNIGDGIEQIETKDLFVSAETLRDNFSDGMMDKLSETAKTIDYNTPNDISNCLTLAYSKYSDLDRMTDIYYRNKNLIKNPSFVPENEILRILDE